MKGRASGLNLNPFLVDEAADDGAGEEEEVFDEDIVTMNLSDCQGLRRQSESQNGRKALKIYLLQGQSN